MPTVWWSWPTPGNRRSGQEARLPTCSSFCNQLRARAKLTGSVHFRMVCGQYKCIGDVIFSSSTFIYHTLSIKCCAMNSWISAHVNRLILVSLNLDFILQLGFDKHYTAWTACVVVHACIDQLSEVSLGWFISFLRKTVVIHFVEPKWPMLCNNQLIHGQ